MRPMSRKVIDIRFSLSQGKIAAQGTPTDLVRSGVDLGTHDEDGTANRRRKSMSGNETPENGSRRTSLRSLSINSTSTSLDETMHSGDDADQQYQFVSQLEESSKGTVNGSTPMNYFKAGGHLSILPLLFISFLATQIVTSSADIWVSVW